MATISARVDEDVKQDAEGVADSIGISLSTAINIFLKRFVAEQGFPFDVKITNNSPYAKTVNRVALESSIKQAIHNADPVPVPPHCTYLEPSSNEIVTHTVK